MTEGASHGGPGRASGKIGRKAKAPHADDGQQASTSRYLLNQPEQSKAIWNREQLIHRLMARIKDKPKREG